MNERPSRGDEATAHRPEGILPPSRRGEARFTPGAILASRYRIVALLGRGGMGEVYRAEDMKLGQQVALKFLPAQLADQPERLAALYQELRLGRQVSHPNVCRLYDVFEWEGGHFISMEYIDGEDLASLLRRIGQLPHGKALEIARDLAAGLAAAHAIGIVHRDLKPANVMIDGRGTARITDFGLAAFGEDLAGSSSTVGTPAYMAPEQLAGGEVTAKTDIYAFGLVLYEMFTGKRLFEATSLGEIISQHQTPRTQSISQQTRDIDPTVQRLILRCLEERPESRPPSIHAVMLALPGGDPLQAAIEAGETPSPEMIAATSVSGETRPAIAWGMLLLAITGILLTAAISARTKLHNLVSLPSEPAVLAHRAAQLIGQFGYELRGHDSSFYLNWDDDYFRFAARKKLDTAVDDVRPSPVVFRYRTSPVELVPQTGQRVVFEDDPPFTVPGMTRIGLDANGRLLYFDVVPPAVVDQKAPAKPVEWRPFFEAAGIDLTALQPVASSWAAPADTQEKFAWDARFTTGEAIHVEAATYAGRAVWFALIPAWRAPFVAAQARQSAAIRFAISFTILAIIAILAVGIVLARRNWRRGRGDRQGALRLASFVAVAYFASRAFRAHHSVEPAIEWSLIELLLQKTFYQGLQIWILYLALEPYVRRRWPRRLISWTRLLSGRFRDPLVGRDVLAGIVAGSAVAIMYQVTILMPALFGMPELSPIRQLFTALSDVTQIAFIVGREASFAASAAVIIGVYLLILQLIFRRTILFRIAAVVVTGLLLFGTGPSGGGGGVNLPVEMTMTLVVATIWVFVFFRFGLVSTATMIFVSGLLYTVPLTLDPSHWYFGRSAVPLALLAALAVYGFRMTVASQPMFSGFFAEDET